MIDRDPQKFASESYDLLVVGGGVYGIALLLEATRRGLRALLIERAKFGGQTSRNSLRIIHGGLRYLQKLDLHRFRESVSERRWFLQHFPDLVRPLPCMMPLYGQGLHRPAVLRAALQLNDLLSCRRNDGVRPENHLVRGQVLDRQQTIRTFPGVRKDGLKGAALWYDGVMDSSEKLLDEMLRWAYYYGGRALANVEAREIISSGSRVVGLRAVDLSTEDPLEFRAPVVVNCAGPWVRDVARRFGRDVPQLYRPSLAFNLYLGVAPPAQVAIAVAPKRGGRTYFLYPWQSGVLAGTFHSAAGAQDCVPNVKHHQIGLMLDDLRDAVPGWKLGGDDVKDVFAGLLPAVKQGTAELETRETILDHGYSDGLTGLYSVSGVKFTTARLVAEKTLRKALQGTSGTIPSIQRCPRPISAQSTGGSRTVGCEAL